MLIIRYVLLVGGVYIRFCMVQDFSTTWDIKATPTFFFLQDGQQVDKLVGANKPELQKKVVAFADSAPCEK